MPSLEGQQGVESAASHAVPRESAGDDDDGDENEEQDDFLVSSASLAEALASFAEPPESG